ncbi:hypothetical protein [Evansella tamaricis]|uniref:Yip1 domain-containing protein n=1 Tax=Evansella tamaricis TaxID=2069301 RepID=A0ABS6JL48_9BACI|nr:hypothetical protein [Evansella tamaricis]MBU9714404.1 hypothetical protein [Evansella tamaricis]
MKTKTIDFREFIRNERIDIELNELKTLSLPVFTTGYVVIGITCVFALAIAISENIAVRKGNEDIAEGIVNFMKLFMPLTIIAALIVLSFFNPLL